jgi:hypothetical protein
LRSRISLYLTNKGQTAIAVAVAIVLSVFVIAVGASDKWLTAVFDTVVVFSALIAAYRPHWASRRFWILVVSALVVHLFVTWLTFGVLLRRRTDVNLVTSVPFIFLECFIVYYFLRYFGFKKLAKA